MATLDRRSAAIRDYYSRVRIDRPIQRSLLQQWQAIVAAYTANFATVYGRVNATANENDR